jgi:hypothetical protein
MLILLPPLLLLGLYIKTQSLSTAGYLSFSWVADRLSPQSVSYLVSFDSSLFSSQNFLLDYISNAAYRLSVIMHTFGLIGAPAERPPILLDVRNALNIQHYSLPISYRAGTSPGLIASFVYVFNSFAVIFLPFYVFLVYKILKPVLSAIPFGPSLQLNLLVCTQLLPIFFQSPFSPLLLFDESFLLVILVLWLRSRLAHA